MNRVKIEEATEIVVKGIYGFIERKVIKFGSGAKVDCPKWFLGRKVYKKVMGLEEAVKLRSLWKQYTDFSQ